MPDADPILSHTPPFTHIPISSQLQRHVLLQKPSNNRFSPQQLRFLFFLFPTLTNTKRSAFHRRFGKGRGGRRATRSAQRAHRAHATSNTHGHIPGLGGWVFQKRRYAVSFSTIPTTYNNSSHNLQKLLLSQYPATIVALSQNGSESKRLATKTQKSATTQIRHRQPSFQSVTFANRAQTQTKHKLM